jgi:oxygen-independent coproporphyrinogen-3 oxidase
MQDAVEAELARAGFERYEVSAYARPGQRCRHNLNYWEFGDYLGIGPGAHGKLSFPGRILRQARARQPETWIERAGHGGHIAETRALGRRDLPFEFMLNALRLKQGVPAAYFAQRTGMPLAAIARPLQAAAARGLLDPDPARLRASDLGWRFLNDVQEIFLPD